MFGIDDLLLGSVAAPAIGGALGSIFSSGDRDSAKGDQAAALQQWLNVNVPDPATQKIILQKYASTGQLTPQIEQAINEGPSAYQNIQTDPALKGAQLRALGSLSQIGDSGGLTLNDQANLQKAQGDLASREKGTRDAITAKYAQRGQGGSGFGLQAQLAAQQGAQNTANENSLSTMASARQRAMDAILKGGNLAGDLRTQDYNQQSDLAKNKDAISQFNARNLQNVNNANVGIQNQAQQYNLNNAQDIANKNTGLANDQEKYNKGLIQQNYNNQLSKAGGTAGAYGQQANNFNQSANRTQDTFGGIGAAVGKGLGAGYQYGNNNNDSSYNDDYDEWARS